MSIAFDAGAQASADMLIQLALMEDLGDRGDVTTLSMVGGDEQGTVQIVARSPGVVAGVPIIPRVFSMLDETVKVTVLLDDGSRVERGAVVAEVSGSVRSLLIGERTVLNFLTQLSGVATLTRKFADAVAGTSAQVYDTRKTLPGWRKLEKYAVRCGGGANHRIGLFDMVLIKDNHLASFHAAHPQATVADAIRSARSQAPPGTPLEVEVDTLEQLRDALAAGPDIVLLDNMSLDQLRQSVALRNEIAPNVQLEASGGVSLSTVADIASTGVERISAGALTHSAPALDLAFDWKQ